MAPDAKDTVFKKKLKLDKEKYELRMSIIMITKDMRKTILPNKMSDFTVTISKTRK